MLKLRVVSALAFAALVVVALIVLPLSWLAAFFHLLVLVAGYEWSKLAGVETRLGWVAYATALSVLVVALWLLSDSWQWVLLAVAGFWLAALVVVCCYPASAALLRSQVALLAMGVVVIVGAWLGLVALAAAGGAELVAWLLLATALADTGAYFVGRRWGRRKLALRLSPGKTWEGALGGGLCVLAWGLFGCWWFGGTAAAWLGMAALVCVAATVGDLLESALKRQRGVKDSGGILPGHGGLLDRIDSALAAAPVFASLVPLLP